MNRQTTKLDQHELQQTNAQQLNTQHQAVLEFASAEEVLRHDAAHTPVPPAVAERLQKSIEGEPKPALCWWQRLFGPS